MTDPKSTRGRLQALQNFVREQNIPDPTIAVPLATLGCAPFQRAEIAHEAEKLKAQQELEARARAARATSTSDAALQRDVQDLETWRAYRAANPFEQARLPQLHSAAIERGRTLDEPEPPKAA